MANKMTNVNALAIAIATLATDEANAEVVAKLTNIKASYEKKNSGERKPTETQILNKGLRTDILDLMESGRGYTVTEICKALPNDYSNQKISRLMNEMVKDNLLTKSTEKRKTLFTKVG